MSRPSGSSSAGASSTGVTRSDGELETAVTAKLVAVRASKFSGFWYTIDELVLILGLTDGEIAYLKKKMASRSADEWLQRANRATSRRRSQLNQVDSKWVLWLHIWKPKKMGAERTLEREIGPAGQLDPKARFRPNPHAPKPPRAKAPASATTKRKVTSPPRGQVTAADGASPPGSARARSRGTSRGAKGRRGDDDGDDDGGDDDDLAPPHLLRGAPPPCAADGNPMEISAVSVDGGGGFGASPTGVRGE